ncbi:MAG: ABC transporter substrate-binding protein [Pseudomonadota bacterium]
MPNIAKSWEWNDDFTELTFHLREGHKWSDGAPFTAADVAFWYNDIILNEEMFPNTPGLWTWDGEPATVEALDDLTVKFTLPKPAPGLLNRFAVGFTQPFQPKHFYEQFHIGYNPDANALAQERGMESWVDLINLYHGGSDWKDTPSPLLKGGADNVVPTLEAFILVAESDKGRTFVANPYFHMVDTAGNQLPYINELEEKYVPEQEVRNLKIVNGEVDLKAQNLFLSDFPLYKDNESNGGFNVHLTPTLGNTLYYSFNTTHPDPKFADVFNDVRFRQAMSMAINRDEILDLVYLGQGRPVQATPAEPRTVAFVTDEHTNAYIQYDPEAAAALLDEMGLKDSDGDGVREFADGSPINIQHFYSNQGGPVQIHELVRGYWEDVGIQLSQREISTDEYRTKAGANDLLVTSWLDRNRSAPAISQENFMFKPPFGDRWQPGTGFEWAVWSDTDGAQGVEPPDSIKTLGDLADQFLLVPLGSEESNRIGGEIADIHAENLWKIGVVGDTVAPLVVNQDIGNFKPYTVSTFDYYFAYPFRPQQWYFKGGN